MSDLFHSFSSLVTCFNIYSPFNLSQPVSVETKDNKKIIIWEHNKDFIRVSLSASKQFQANLPQT